MGSDPRGKEAMEPTLPVIYENPTFDASTPTLKPVIDRAIRFGAVMMLEWGTLTLIEETPRYLKISTVVIAALILAVHESWPWLRMRNKYIYPVFMLILIVTYIIIFCYALLTQSSSTTKPITPSSITIPSLPAPFISPIHEKSAKWDIVQGIRNAIMRNGLNPECHITIVRESAAYAEDYATDFKEILDVLNWKVDGEHLGAVNKEITIRAINEGQSKECAEALAARIRTFARTRKGSGPGDPLQWFIVPDASIYIKQCTSVCIEVDFGIEDTTQ